MFERFTDRARKVMQLANSEAQRLNHEYIGTEHILLGLIKEGSGVAANTLKNLDVDLRKVRQEVERIVVSGPDRVKLGKLPHTPQAKKVLEHSIEEARLLKHNYVGTEHLLLGLLREQDGVAAQVLMNLGLKLEDVRGEVLNLLGQSMGSPQGPGDQAGLSSGLDLYEALMHLPEEFLRALKEASDRIEKLCQDKEEEIAEQDFVKAAGLRDKQDKIKRWLLDMVKKLQTFLHESEDDSNS